MFEYAFPLMMDFSLSIYLSRYIYLYNPTGRFLGALLETVSCWHSSESSYAHECAKTPGFISMMRSFTAGSEKQYLDYENYRHITFKWHFKLTKSLVILLESKDYIQVRYSRFKVSNGSHTLACILVSKLFYIIAECSSVRHWIADSGLGIGS